MYVMLMTGDSSGVDAAFSALAHPVRRTILEHLAEGEAIVTELAEPFDVSQPAISRHLKVLRDAGLVTHRVEGNRRPYRLSADGVATLDRWMELLRTALSANYRRLDTLLAATNSDPHHEDPS